MIRGTEVTKESPKPTVEVYNSDKDCYVGIDLSNSPSKTVETVVTSDGKVVSSKVLDPEDTFHSILEVTQPFHKTSCAVCFKEATVRLSSGSGDIQGSCVESISYCFEHARAAGELLLDSCP